MNTRRDFLRIAVKGSAMAAATTLLPRTTSASGTAVVSGTARELLKVAGDHGVDLRTAALRFSAAPDVAAALVVGCRSEQQILADYTSMQTKIPAEFWTELKTQKLIEQNAPVPA